MIRVGIVGLGHVATHHVNALEWCDDFQLVAGYDTDAEALRRLPESASRYEQLEQLLNNRDVDAVVIASRG